MYRYYILSKPNILWSILNTYYILDSSWSCINCYISPLRPSAHTAAYSAHNPCRPRETRYLAFLGLPVKSYRPKPSRPMSKVFQYLVLFTVHQPQYIVVSYGSMNMCILHRYVSYNILYFRAIIYTIYSNPWETARLAVSHAVYTLCGKLHHHNDKLRDNADIAPLSRDFALCACVVCGACSS